MRATSPSTPSSTEANCATRPPVVACPIANEAPAASVAQNEAIEICHGDTLRERSRSVMRRESGRLRCRAIRPSETPTAAASTLRRARATSSACTSGSLRTACHSSATLRVATGSRRADQRERVLERARLGRRVFERARERGGDPREADEHAVGRAQTLARGADALARPDAAGRVPAGHARRAVLRGERVAAEVHRHDGRDGALGLLREAREQAPVEPVVGARDQVRLVAVEPRREALHRHEPHRRVAAAARRELARGAGGGLGVAGHHQLGHAGAEQRERGALHGLEAEQHGRARGGPGAARTGWRG